MRRRWKRIEPGYYALVGTDYEIANMKGQSVKHSGPMTEPWQVRRGGRVRAEVGTMREAKAEALRLAGSDDRA